MTTINTRAAANLVALFNAAAVALIDLNAAVKAGTAKAFKPNSVVFADITLEELEGMIAPFAGVDTETAPAAKATRVRKNDPDVESVTFNIKATEVRGQKIGYTVDGKRKSSEAVKVVTRNEVRGAVLADGTFAPLTDLVRVAGKRFAFELVQAEAAPVEKPAAKAGRKPKAATVETKPAAKAGRKPKAATAETKPAAKPAAAPKASEGAELKVSEVRGAKVTVSYKWGGETQFKTVTVDKVVTRDEVRVALAGDLTMEFDKIERDGKKLVYTGRVSKADFAAI